MPVSDAPDKAARQAALSLLSRREYSRKELREKLLRRFPPDVVESALAVLAEQRLQNDERFAESFVHARRNRGHGPRRIARELSEKGIDRESITRLLEDEDEQAWPRLQALHARRFGLAPPADLRERARRQRFFLARGYSPSQIERLFRRLGMRDTGEFDE